MFRSDFSEKAFLDKFERLVVALEKQVSVMPPPVQVKNFDDIRAFLRKGEKIQAIKLFRELTGAGLYDAKNAVESIQFRHEP